MKFHQSGRDKVHLLLARQLGHLMRDGLSYEQALSRLGEAGGEELRYDIEALKRALAGAEGGEATGRAASLMRLAQIARQRGGDAAAILRDMDEVLGPLGESYRAYWAGIGGFLLYAFALLAVGSLALAVVSIFVFPAFSQIFRDAGAALPPYTESLRAALNVFFVAAAVLVVVLGVAAYEIRDSMARLEPLGGLAARVPGLRRLCDSYNKAIFLNFSHLLARSGIAARDALDEVSRLQQPRAGHWAGLSPRSASDIAASLRDDAIAGTLLLAHRAGTLERELAHLSGEAQSLFADALVKVREEFTLVMQIVVGVLIASFVVSVYLPIFRIGSVL